MDTVSSRIIMFPNSRNPNSNCLGVREGKWVVVQKFEERTFTGSPD